MGRRYGTVVFPCAREGEDYLVVAPTPESDDDYWQRAKQARCPWSNVRLERRALTWQLAALAKAPLVWRLIPPQCIEAVEQAPT